MKKQLLAVAIAAHTSLAAAEQKTEEVFVSATLTEQPVLDVLGSASVITAEEIFIQQPRDLSDILDMQTSADITRTGSRGSAASLFTRGSNSDHTLILVNGQRISSATLGSAQFQLIDPEQIKRVEYLKGSRSSLYGSEAIGGVLQVFTQQGQEAFEGYVTGELGTTSTGRIAAGASGSVENFRYSAAGSYLESDGIDSLVDDTGFNADEDGYTQANINLYGAVDLAEGITLSGSHFLADLENDYDSPWAAESSQPYSESTLTVTGLNLEADVTDFYTTQIALGLMKNDSDDLDRQNADASSQFDTQRESVFWQNNLTLNAQNSLTLGVDYYDESVDASVIYQDENGNAIDSRDVTAVFAQYQTAFDVVDLAFGLRNDDSSAYGDKATGSVAGGIAISESHRVYASWNEGFKAPTFNDMYWPNSGNPNLLPEESESIEIGVKRHLDHWRYELAYFENDIDNLIEWAPISDAADAPWQPQNVDQAEISGWEFSAGVSMGNVNLDGGMSYVDPINKVTGETLANRAKRKLTLDLSHDLAQWTYGATLKAQGERAVNFGDPISGYGIVGIYASYQPVESLVVRLRVDNIFDKEYQLNERYNEEGTNGSVKLTYSF